VGFESSAPGQTRFTLVAVDLPSGIGSGSGKSD
jgi:NAD(P)H-hydrate repair Nnr-like enzyme with NAD(P)H-hydrate epimerase domain